jgi:4,5-DOPA dioxygenase extradiol
MSESVHVTDRLPAVFIGHGSPMNTLEHNRYTDAWRAFGESVVADHGRPRGILAISAHWFINAAAVTAMGTPRVIHDFFGFPDELFAFDYPAPGDPVLAAEVAEVVRPTWVGLDADSWGIDHGTWSVLAHMFPEADIPVVQLSLDGTKSADEHIDLGARLAPLRDRGVLIVASGNIVHNLRLLDWTAPDGAFDWARRFDDAARSRLVGAPAEMAALEEHADYGLAVPTPDHYLPLLYLAGLSAASGDTARSIVDGYSMGSLSMTSYQIAA